MSITQKGRETLQKVRGKDLIEITMTDYYWMVAELDRLYNQVDQLEANRLQREHFAKRISSQPPPLPDKAAPLMSTSEDRTKDPPP